MKIPRPRPTARRLVILVALAALMPGGLAILKRRREFAHAMWSYYMAKSREETLSRPWVSDDPRGISRLDRLGTITRSQKAASRPWLPSDADPPPPE